MNFKLLRYKTSKPLSQSIFIKKRVKIISLKKSKRYCSKTQRNIYELDPDPDPGIEFAWKWNQFYKVDILLPFKQYYHPMIPTTEEC